MWGNEYMLVNKMTNEKGTVLAKFDNQHLPATTPTIHVYYNSTHSTKITRYALGQMMKIHCAPSKTININSYANTMLTY